MNKNQKNINNFLQTIIVFTIVYLILKNFSKDKLDDKSILTLSLLMILVFRMIPEITKNKNNIIKSNDQNQLYKADNNFKFDVEVDDYELDNNNYLIRSEDISIEKNDNNNQTSEEKNDNNGQVSNKNVIINDEMSLEDIYDLVNNKNTIDNYEYFTDDKEEKKYINYESIDRKIKLKFNLNKLNKIELEDGRYIINEEFNTYGYNNFIISDGELIYADSNKKYKYNFDKKLKRYIDKDYSLIFLKNKDFFIDQDFDKIFFKKLKFSSQEKEKIKKDVNKDVYVDKMDDLDEETTKNARVRYYTYRKYVDKDEKEKYKLINNKFYDKSLDDKVFMDLNTIPHDIRNDNYDPNKTYGYSYVPPNEWYDIPSREKACITDDTGPFIRPTLTDGTSYDSLFWTSNIEKE